MRHCCHPIYCLLSQIAANISVSNVNMLAYFITPKNRTFILSNAGTVLTHLYGMFLNAILQSTR